MAAPFFRTTRSLEQDAHWRSLVALAVVALLVAGWGGWFFAARVAVYEVTDRARLEVERAAHTATAAVAGRVAKAELTVGRHVEAGELLVELESEKERRRLDEEKARLAGLQPQLDALQRELGAESDALERSRGASRTAADEARARHAQAETAMRLAAEEQQRLERVHAAGAISDAELARARAEAQKRRAEADALALDVERLGRDQLTSESSRRAHVEELRRDQADLQARAATTRAAIEVLAQELERHRIYAPIDGQLAEAAPLRPGAAVREGEPLATIVPSGELRIVAELRPEAALGRVVPGQPARLRLEGFPWTQFGAVRGRVTRVAAEPRGGTLRVELAVVEAPPAIPMQHGLAGTLEIEVEHATPATLVLRATGQLLARPIAVERPRG